MPANTLPPLIMQMDAGSVPVGYLAFKSKTHTLGEIGDLAQNRIRALVQAYVPGTVATSPFGTGIRSIVISLDPGQTAGSYNLIRPMYVRPVSALRRGTPSARPKGISTSSDENAARSQQRYAIRDPGRTPPAAVPLTAGGATSTFATWGQLRTPPTSTMAMPWWTADHRSTCRSSRRTRPPLCKWSKT